MSAGVTWCACAWLPSVSPGALFRAPGARPGAPWLRYPGAWLHHLVRVRSLAAFRLARIDFDFSMIDRGRRATFYASLRIHLHGMHLHEKCLHKNRPH